MAVNVVRRRRALVAALACLSCAGGGRESERPPIAITHTNVVLVDSARVESDMTVVVDGAVISAVGRTGALVPPRGSQVIDGRRWYVIPGLWDMHVHVTFDGRGTDAALSALVARGITGVRDMGGGMDAVRDIRARTDAGLLAPRVVAAGRLIDGTSGYADPTWRINVGDSLAALSAVDSVLAEGSELVKVHDWLPRAAFQAVAARARERRVPLVGHVPIDVGAIAAVDAGQRSVEHLGNVYGGYFLDFSRREEHFRRELLRYKRDTPDSILSFAFSAPYIADLLASFDSAKARALVARMAERGVWQVPTLVLQRANAQGRADTKKQAANPQTAAQLERLYARQLQLVRAMHDAGVPFLTGTDSWFAEDPISTEAVHDELHLFVQAGFTPAEALRTATLYPATFLGLEASAGTVAPGKLADLVLLEANPLDDIANTERIAAVVRGGRLVRKSEADSLVRAARAALQAKK
jgi:imidazolonepropionase-like amidohydrolase